jgi:hypothetical protein
MVSPSCDPKRKHTREDEDDDEAKEEDEVEERK